MDPGFSRKIKIMNDSLFHCVVNNPPTWNNSYISSTAQLDKKSDDKRSHDTMHSP